MSKVSIVRCGGYDKQELFEAVERSLDLLGGIERFVKKGQSVLLKPNLLKIAKPDEPAITHPEFVRAVVRLVKTQTDKIFIGDSPGGLVKIEDIYEKCRYRQMADEENVKLVRFDDIVKIKGIPFAKIKDEVDVVISLPKFKTHAITTITCAVKNIFGLVPGLYKVHCHKLAPNFNSFAKELVKIYSLAKPDLTIIDAVQAMQGDGPSGGPVYDLKLVLASSDAVSADAVVSKIIGLDPLDVPSTKYAHGLNIGQAGLNDIEIAGEPISEVRAVGFMLPKIMAIYKIPNFLLKTILRFIPLMLTVDPEKCNNCLMCAKICPQKTISQVRGKIKINSKNCILCLCCSEMCPNNAVYLRFLKRRKKDAKQDTCC
jgi:uncharacterized protein (DUF362 family)/NAD-dependent dihydropyrimidine dehydrogenase PreA subunit